MEKCKFCQIVNKNLGDYILWEDKDLMAILEIKPAKEYQFMLIPKKHTDYVFDIEDKLYLKMMKKVKDLSKPLKKITKAKKIGIIVMGFEIPHAHIHLIPLHKKGEIINPNKYLRKNSKDLKKNQEKLIGVIKNDIK